MQPLWILGNTIDSERQFTNNIYAHGELEKMCGFDLVTVAQWGTFIDNVDEGIYDAKFECPDGKVFDAKAFVWNADIFDNRKYMKGLVVKADDEKYLVDATHKYLTKAIAI